MSTIAYGALSTARKSADRNKLADDTGLGTLVDVLTGLVPAEVLAAHALILTYATETKDDGSVSITEKGALQLSFFFLLGFSMLLYLAGRYSKKGARDAFDKWDLLRMLVPPAAFVVWTMIQKNTAFDALTTWDGNQRIIVAILLTLVVAFAATTLSVQANRA
jgi:hypothetical protein